jgi:2-polyprenyl-6-methoxyphenol hydroxylase-like FAD-dependent oxidoreductase
VKRRVEIAGAGVAGLTTGLAFAQKGWHVRVREQGDTLRIPGVGIYLWENGLRVLDALGVSSAVIAGVIPTARHEKRNQYGTMLASSPDGPALRLYVPARETLLQALYEALLETGGEVRFGSRAVAADPDGWLRLADGSVVRADLVVAADGVDSMIRDNLGLLKWRRSAGQFAYCSLIRLEPGEIKAEAGRTHCEYWNGSRRLLYAPSSAELAHVQLTSLEGDSPGNAVPIDRDFWRGQFPDLAWIVDRIPEGERGDWFEIIRLKGWSCGRVVIVGDAACAQPPSLGQAVGCSMMAAFVLAQMIDREDDVLDGIASWQLQQRCLTEWVQRVPYWYGQLAFLPAAARTAVFKAVDASDWVKRQTLFLAATRDVTKAALRSQLSAAHVSVHPLIH